MGFRPQRKIHKLVFDGTDLDGLIVRMKSCSVAEWNETLEMMNFEGTPAEAKKANETLNEVFAGRIIEWNMEDPDTGDPVPTTKEGFESLEQGVAARIIAAWM